MPIDESIPVATGSQQQLPSGQQLQVVRVHASSSGYDNPSPVVNAGQAVRLDFSADSSAGCGRQLILDGVGTSVNLVSRNGQTVSATFTPPSPGQYRFHCGMNMFRGVLTAK
jgi:plastocyanin domain-containing protein